MVNFLNLRVIETIDCFRVLGVCVPCAHRLACPVSSGLDQKALESTLTGRSNRDLKFFNFCGIWEKKQNETHRNKLYIYCYKSGCFLAQLEWPGSRRVARLRVGPLYGEESCRHSDWAAHLSDRARPDQRNSALNTPNIISFQLLFSTNLGWYLQTRKYFLFVFAIHAHSYNFV